MKKLGIFTIISIMFLISSALAVELSVSPASQIARQGDVASYTFTITSPSSSRYSVSTYSSNAAWITMPNSVDLSTGNQFTVQLTVPRDAPATTYGFPITLSGSNHDTVTETIYVSVKSKDGIKIDSLAPISLNYRAGEVVTMDLKLTSQEPLPREVIALFNIKNLDGSTLKEVPVYVSIQPDTSIDVQQPFDFGKLAPGKYSVSVVVKAGNYVYDSQVGSFEVSPLVTLVKTKESHWTFLAIENIIKITNIGNDRAQNVQVQDTVPAFWSFFVRDAPTQKQTVGSDTSYTWRLTELNANGSSEMKYQIILWPIYLLILVLGFAGFKGYTMFMTPMITKNFADRSNLGQGKEGSVVIHAKNKGFRTLQNVVIDDKIPASFKITDSSVPRPKYRKAAHGSELRWSLGTLAPGEERVFSYKLKNMMGILGTVELPRASMVANGNKIYKSKTIRTSGDKTKEKI